jgi:hypothetical protein
MVCDGVYKVVDKGKIRLNLEPMDYLYHFVYLSYESHEGGRMYIGKHSTNNLYDGYMGSFNDPHFCPDSRIILQYYFTEIASIAGEIQWQKVFRVAEDAEYANRAYQTSDRFYYPWDGKKRSELDRKRKSIAAKGKPKSPEHRKKLSEARAGMKLSESHRRNIGLSGLGRVVTEETREKIRRKKLGVKQSREHVEALSKIRKGKKWWNNGEQETQALVSPGSTWNPGRLPRKPSQKDG